MTWRLALDMGSNSLGWAALDLEQHNHGFRPCWLKDSGVRIFSDGRNPKDKQSNAVKRREPRSVRKNRDRYKRRRQRLMRQLIQYGLMPEKQADRKALEGGKGVSQGDTDPWILRFRAMRQDITPHQLGRAIFHLHQRRGFKSNRKTDRGDNESGKVYDAIARTKEMLKEEGVRTLGELFGKRRAETFVENSKSKKGQRSPQPLARVRKSDDGAQWQYKYYPTRELILDEFDQIWQAQKQYHAALLTDEARDAIRDTLEWQHPLKSPPVGKCTLMPEFPRAPKALPSSQRGRILQEVNNLRMMPVGQSSTPLSDEQRGMITESLLKPTSKTAKRTFDQLRKIKGVSIYDNFNLESDKRKDLQGDATAAALMQEDRWGASWFELDLATQDEIVMKLIDEEDEIVLIKWLCDTHGLGIDQAGRVAGCALPEGYGNLSREALARILPHLEGGMSYADAATKEFGDHRPQGTGEIHDKELPYYGYVLERSVAFGSGEPEDSDEKRYGKVANPTVHVALNQIRVVVNDLMRRFGPPEQIVLELARDLPLSAKGKSELESTQRKNREANERRAQELYKLHNQPNTYENRMRLRLYEELDALGKRCVFTGEHITASNLFSDDVEIEHLLPFSRTFDDGFNNKVLCKRRANRDKGNRTPYEAFGASPNGYNWEEISKRAQELPKAKSWRFNPDAMERFENEERNFIDRQLTDTQYVSRLAKAYLESIFGGQGHVGSHNHVWVVTGHLTSDLRHTWGLNSVLLGDNLPEAELQKKNRDDHRHHAIDAIVIGCIDRSMLKRASDEAKKREIEERRNLLGSVPEPWQEFRTDVENSVRSIIVSHKPDHGFQDAMHNDTAYGLFKGKEGEPDKRGARKVVTRKPVSSFEKPGDLEKIRDYPTKVHLLEATQGLSGSDFKQALAEAAENMVPPVRRVRIEERMSVIPFKDQEGRPYKAYKGDGNYCYDIWLDEKGKWTGEVIATFQAYQLARKDKGWWQKPIGRDEQKLLMRLRKGDYLQLDHDGNTLVVQIYKFSDGKINMAEHMEANVDARVRSGELKSIQKSPSSLQKANAKRVTVSPSGTVKVYD